MSTENMEVVNAPKQETMDIADDSNGTISSEMGLMEVENENVSSENGKSQVAAPAGFNELADAVVAKTAESTITEPPTVPEPITTTALATALAATTLASTSAPVATTEPATATEPATSAAANPPIHRPRRHPAYILHGMKRMFHRMPVAVAQKKSKNAKDEPQLSDEDELERFLLYTERGEKPEITEGVKRLLKNPMYRREILDEIRYFGEQNLIQQIIPFMSEDEKKVYKAPEVHEHWREPLGQDGWVDIIPTIPQTKPLDDTQVKNHAGGYSYAVDDRTRLRRLFCLGTENGSYYQKAHALAAENLGVVKRLLADNRGEEVVEDVITFSSGRCAKVGSLLIVLAMCAEQSSHLSTKRAAYKALPQVCHIPTHLFQFMEFYNKLRSLDGQTGRGWGRAHRIGITNWYLSFKNNPRKLANHVTKYRNRNGWTHVDVMRLAHPKPNSTRGSPGLAAVMKFVVKGIDVAKTTYMNDEADKEIKDIFQFLEATEEAKKLRPHDEEAACELIAKHRLVREHLPTEMLNSYTVWRALLQNMPMTALVRNLGKMTCIRLLAHGGEGVQVAIDKLTNHEQLRGAKMHPFNILLARHQYQAGQGDKGSLSWEPNPDIIRALEDAFYLSFKAFQPTNKRICIALDISGSMDFTNTIGSPMKVRDAACAMAMTTVRTEKKHKIVGFHHNLIELGITPEMDLHSVMEETKRHGFGSTDCGKPMTWATENKKLFDAFIIYTDNETYAGHIHPSDALKKYRDISGISDAKLIVVAMASNGFTIADPQDRYMLDVAGFDSDAPDIMTNFIMGNI